MTPPSSGSSQTDMSLPTEVDQLVSWCSSNNLKLNTQNTVEIIGLQDLNWEPTISSLIKKAQQRMFFLQQLRELKMPTKMMLQFHTAITESVLTSSIPMWYAGATTRGRHRLQRIVHITAKGDWLQPPISTGPVRLKDFRMCRADPSHPRRSLFIWS